MKLHPSSAKRQKFQSWLMEDKVSSENFLVSFRFWCWDQKFTFSISLLLSFVSWWLEFASISSCPCSTEGPLYPKLYPLPVCPFRQNNIWWWNSLGAAIKQSVDGATFTMFTFWREFGNNARVAFMTWHIWEQPNSRFLVGGISIISEVGTQVSPDSPV